MPLYVLKYKVISDMSLRRGSIETVTKTGISCEHVIFFHQQRAIVLIYIIENIFENVDENPSAKEI